MITYRPRFSSAGRSGPAYDDAEIVERLDVLEANRSTSAAFRVELRSRINGLTLESRIEDLAPIAGFFTLNIRTPTNEIRISAFGGSLRDIVDDISRNDFDRFLEAVIDNGQFVIRPSNATQPLHVTTSDPSSVIEIFDIDETWFGQDVYPRPAGTYDTTSAAVRLTGPAGAYAPGSGISVSTALEALKRLHHARDTVVEDREFYVVPDGMNPNTVTLRQIGARIGQTARLTWIDNENANVNGASISVTDLDETVVSFIRRIPQVGFAFSGTNAPGRNVIEFNTAGDFWHIQNSSSGDYGSVRIESLIFRTPPLIRRVLSRTHSSDIFASTTFNNLEGTFPVAASGLLSTMLGSILEEIRSLRARIANLEARP